MAVQETTAQRQPTKLDYSSRIQFRFEILYLPLVEYFVQSANVPGLQLGTATVPTPIGGARYDHVSSTFSHAVAVHPRNGQRVYSEQ